MSDVSVRFGSTVALDSAGIDVGDGETVALLGPSGCGKSTLLRVIAGLQQPETGSIVLDGRDLAGTPPHRRDMGLMFQDHVLFGHRDVAANVGFGPRMAGRSRAETAQAVDDVLELVGLPGFGSRDVATLSGGEAQRVALARSLAARPRLLMLDEPMGSLDRALRDRLVEQLPLVLDEVGVATIHVTHDHDEAFAVADRVAVMRAGRIERMGTPVEIWRDPRSELTARFLGHQNLIDVGPRGRVPWGVLDVEPGRWVVRSDSIAPARPGSSRTLTAVVSARRYRGDRFELLVRTDPGDVELTVMWPDDVDVGSRLTLSVDEGRLARVD